MKTSPQENAQRWIESWKRASVALKAVKRHELRTYDYAKNQAIVDGMLQWAFEHRKVRLSSGLVEQQHLFMKMKSALSDPAGHESRTNKHLSKPVGEKNNGDD